MRLSSPARALAFDFGDLHGEVGAAFEVPDLEGLLRRAIEPANAERTLHWGRNYLYTVRVETLDGPRPVVVKTFRHDGLRERLRRRSRGSKAERSWRAARAVLAAGVLTPEPLALIESRAAAGPAWYVCEMLDDALELRYFLRALNAGRAAAEYPGIDGAELLGAVAGLARRLHAAGVWHRDLTGGNLLAPWSGPGEGNARAIDAARLHLLDLNRARLDRPLTASERMRDLSRFPALRTSDQDFLLSAYFGEPATEHAAEVALYRGYHRGFLWKNQVKPRLRAPFAWLRSLFVSRGAHAHIPAAPAGAAARDRIVWDALSDQPHQHAGRWERLAVRLTDLPTHAAALGAATLAAPRIWRRYRALTKDLYRSPAPFDGLGICVRPWPQNPPALLDALDGLGVRKVLLRLHPWESDHAAEEELARALQARGYELCFALPQNRDLVRDPERWRAAVEELGERFVPYGRQFQLGQAINRSKWGVWTLREYLALAASAAEALRRHPGVELMGPAVIDFEYYQTAAALNAKGDAYFDIVSALLYVDRRGAPENRQMGLDTVDKVVLLKAIADTAKRAGPRAWITEVNWPLWEGPHSPAGRKVSVDEERQADYLVRYMIEALATGCVERVYWWQLVARGYGLIAPDGEALRRRPAYRALATLAETLGGATLVERRTTAAGAWLYRFRRADGRTWTAAWCVGEPISLEHPSHAVRTRDGETVTAARARAALSSSPVYLFETA